MLGAHQAQFAALPRDRQCVVADKVLAAKEQLKATLKAHILARPDPAAPVTPEDIHQAVQSMARAPVAHDSGNESDDGSVGSAQEGY